jgi:hypothetical protein
MSHYWYTEQRAALLLRAARCALRAARCAGCLHPLHGSLWVGSLSRNKRSGAGLLSSSMRYLPIKFLVSYLRKSEPCYAESSLAQLPVVVVVEYTQYQSILDFSEN